MTTETTIYRKVKNIELNMEFIDVWDMELGAWVPWAVNPIDEPVDGALRSPFTCWDDTVKYKEIYSRKVHDWTLTWDKCPDKPLTVYDYLVEGGVVEDAVGEIVYTATDFTAALKWALGQANKVTYIPKGNYTINSYIYLANGVGIVGDGDGDEGTVLNFTYLTSNSKGRGFVANNTNDTQISKVKIVGHGTIEYWATTAACRGHVLDDVTVSVSNKSPWGIATWVGNKQTLSDLTFNNVIAKNCGTNGFHLGGDKANIPEPSTTGCRAAGGWVKNVQFNGCWATGNGLTSRYNDYTVGFDLAEGVNVENIVLNDCVADNNWMNGFHLEQWPYTKAVKFVNCVANYNGVTRTGGGYGWMCRNETGVHETVLENCAGVGNKSGERTCSSL